MKLNIIDPRQRPSNGFISEIKAISIAKNNLFRFSKPAFESLNIEDGTRIDFLQDDKDETLFYLMKNTKGLIKVHSRKKEEFSFTSKYLKRKILIAYGIEDFDRNNILLIKEPIKYEGVKVYPLKYHDESSLIMHVKRKN